MKLGGGTQKTPDFRIQVSKFEWLRVPKQMKRADGPQVD